MQKASLNHLKRSCLQKEERDGRRAGQVSCVAEGHDCLICKLNTESRNKIGSKCFSTVLASRIPQDMKI